MVPPLAATPAEPTGQDPVPAGADIAEEAPAATPASGTHDRAAADTGVPADSSSATTPTRAERPSPAEVLANRTPVPAGETVVAPGRAVAPSSAPAATSSPPGGAMLPGPTSSAGNGGGSGTPARGSGPGSWPGMPGSIRHLELFPQLTAADADAFFGDIEQPPGPPAFDPGSTPD